MFTAMGVVMESCTHPPGSTVTAVTCAEKDGGRVVATSRPAASLGDNSDPGAPGATGTVRRSKPGGRAPGATWSTRPSPLSTAQVLPGAAMTRRGTSSVTAMCTPSGHETCAPWPS